MGCKRIKKVKLCVEMRCMSFFFLNFTLYIGRICAGDGCGEWMCGGDEGGADWLR
jgi:hypothetical protein